MPASEVSQQISTAGKEASGTGNMKFMMNGALTVGTLDGANVEMHDLLGDENMFLFGLHADEVEQLQPQATTPTCYYQRDPVLRRVLDQLNGRLPGRRYLRGPVPAAGHRHGRSRRTSTCSWPTSPPIAKPSQRMRADLSATGRRGTA